MAGELGVKQSSLESRERVVCTTQDGGEVVLLDDERLAIYDKRRRRIVTITDLGALFDAFDGMEI